MAVKNAILIVDDNPVDLTMLAAILREAGYSVITASDGDTALTMARTVMPALIVLDIQLENVNGFDVCREMKKSESTRSIPVIFISAAGNESDKINSFHAGGVDFITKPFRSEIVYARIKTHITLRQMQLSLENENAKLLANEEVLRQSEERYRSIYERSPVGLANVNAHGRILRCNKALEKFWGYSEAELKQMTFADFTLREDAPIGLVEMNRLTRNETDSIVVEKRYVRKDGRIVWGRVTASAIRDNNGDFLYTISIVEDITDRKYAQEKMKRSELQLRMVWEQSAECMRLTNERGIMIMVNAAFCRMVDKKRGEVEGQPFDSMYADDDRQRSVRLHKERFSERGVSALYDGEFTLWNNKKRWLEVSYSFINFQKEPLLLAIFRDVTDKKKIEQELKENREILVRKTEQLEMTINNLQQMQDTLVQSEKMASIGQLTAGIAHEINNPLAFVSSNLNRFMEYFDELKTAKDTLQQFSCDLQKHLPADRCDLPAVPLLNEAEVEFISQDFVYLMGHTRSGVERIKKIVEQLRGFSHVSGQEFTEGDINRALDDTLTITWNELKYKVEIVKEYGALPPVWCNMGELKQVFVNLLVNAAHAIVEKGMVTIRTVAETDGVLIQITDTGCGIPQENLLKVFDPFFTTKPVGKGTGLGLWISATLIRRHHGTLTVSSTVGEGATFSIRLPYKPADVEEMHDL